jgi:hypothetical protein
MSRSLLALVMLVAAACGDDDTDPNFIDGGIDLTAAIDFSGPIDVLPAQLCTTPACAAQPCTVGCMFEIAGGACSASAPSPVASKTVAACKGFCRGVQFQAGQAFSFGYCWHYDDQLPGLCQVPTCGWNANCEVHSYPYSQNEAVICDPDDACFDGRPPGDLAAICLDMGDGGAAD